MKVCEIINETIIFESNEWPQIASNQEVIDLVRSIHHSPQDFDEGDIEHRIDKYSDYILKRIRVSKLTSVWNTNDDSASQFAKMDSKTAPPIVYDRLSREIIDGTHRLEAAKLRGDKTILAYVGYHVDKDWNDDWDEYGAPRD